MAEIQKTKQLRTDFNKLKSTYGSQVDDLRRKLEAENSRREQSHSEAVQIEQRLIEASKENFELKTDMFQKEIDRTKFENK